MTTHGMRVTQHPAIRSVWVVGSMQLACPHSVINTTTDSIGYLIVLWNDWAIGVIGVMNGATIQFDNSLYRTQGIRGQLQCLLYPHISMIHTDTIVMQSDMRWIACTASRPLSMAFSTFSSLYYVLLCLFEVVRFVWKKVVSIVYARERGTCIRGMSCQNIGRVTKEDSDLGGWQMRV